jgi:hypothetical protein
MFIKKCSSCQHDCKKDEICEKYKRIVQNSAGPPGYRGRPNIGLYHLRGSFEAPYHRKLNPDVPEHNKWIANDYMKLIKKYWLHDENRGGNLEVLANAIVNTFDSLWSNGDKTGKIDENMPEEQRKSIYWKKTLTAYPYALLDKKKEENRTFNAMITGVPMEVVNEEPEEDAGIKVEKLFKWMDEHLWDLAKNETFEKMQGKRKVSRRVIQGMTPAKRRKNFELALKAMRLHYIDQMEYREIAKLFNIKYPQNLNRMVLMLFPVIAKHQEEIFSEK